MSASHELQPGSPSHGDFEVDPEVAQDEGETDRDDSESVLSSTASITSSILEYRKINGRTFASSSTTDYWAPNDDQHLEGFDVAHHWITKMLDDKLYLAPIGDNPQRILDVGTGSGIWAIDVADEHPSAEIIGTDITPTQPGWVPPNLKFQIEDAQLDWTFAPESFDFIHVRYLQGAIDDWPRLYNQIYKFLKPGGWFQHLEPDIELRSDNPAVTVNKDHIFQRWAQLFYDAGDKLGRTFRFSGNILDDWAADAGFTDVVHRKFKIPYGSWPKDAKLKELGSYTGHYLDLSLDGFAVFPVGQLLGWSIEEVQVLVAQMRAAVLSRKNLTNGDMSARPPPYFEYGAFADEIKASHLWSETRDASRHDFPRKWTTSWELDQLTQRSHSCQKQWASAHANMSLDTMSIQELAVPVFPECIRLPVAHQ